MNLYIKVLEKKTAIGQRSIKIKKKSILIPQKVSVSGHVRLTKTASSIIEPYQRMVNKISPELHKSIRPNDTIDNIENLTPIGNEEHTSGVYTTKIGKDLHYFKPTKDERYFGFTTPNNKRVQTDKLYMRKKILLKYYRDGIKNDNLGEREILSHDVSDILGLNFIPPTKMVKTKNGDTGVLQLSSHVFEKRKSPDKKVRLQTEKAIDSKMLKNLVDNGNILDVALFDFITGNTDRHAGNVYLRRTANKNTPDDEDANISPIDHGLSFPVHAKDEITHDYTNTATFLWSALFNPSGKNAKISESFLKKLSSERTFVDFVKRINNSSIEKEAKDASIYRLRAVMDIVKKKNHANRMLKNPVYAQHATPSELKTGLEISSKFGSKDFLNLLNVFLDNGIKNARSKKAKQNAQWFKECVNDFEKIPPFINKLGRPFDNGGVSSLLPESKRIKFKPLLTPIP